MQARTRAARGRGSAGMACREAIEAAKSRHHQGPNKGQCTAELGVQRWHNIRVVVKIMVPFWVPYILGAVL